MELCIKQYKDDYNREYASYSFPNSELKFIETESRGQFWINDYEAIFVGNQLIDGLICLFFSCI